MMPAMYTRRWRRAPSRRDFDGVFKKRSTRTGRVADTASRASEPPPVRPRRSERASRAPAPRRRRRSPWRAREHIARAHQHRVADLWATTRARRPCWRCRRGWGTRGAHTARSTARVLARSIASGLVPSTREGSMACASSAVSGAEGDMTPSGASPTEAAILRRDVRHVLDGERLEVEPVPRCRSRRDGLGVAVDHDGLVAGRSRHRAWTQQ